MLGATTPLTNQSIIDKGNAALALGLFGSTKRLVWYRPSFADESGMVADGDIPSPPWVALTFALLATRGGRRGRLAGASSRCNCRGTDARDGTRQ